MMQLLQQNSWTRVGSGLKLTSGLQGSKPCTLVLEVIFPEGGDLEVRLAPVPQAVLVGHPCWWFSRAIRRWKPSFWLRVTCSSVR